MAQAFWPKLPVILETGHYGGCLKRGGWSPELFLRSVEDYHASFMSIHWWPRELLEANRKTIDKINLRLGYRLQPVEVTWPKSVEVGTSHRSYTQYGDLSGGSDVKRTFKVQWAWTNKGVAPCYPGGFPAITLKDSKGGIVSVLADDTLNMRDLKVGPAGSFPITRHEKKFAIGLFGPTTRPGIYNLFISVGRRDGTPQIALPLKENDGQRRYRLGSITIEGRRPAND